MATLILGAVGSAVAGPVGGALGALVGNRLDNAVLGRRREGPRLAELAVQTSSYGTPISLLFGTMRVAGTVIWSTDLRESRDRSGGGKGRAATTTYSYSASFAVALSGRAIERIGRIWADGRLLRGSAGDLKVKATLRVHTGGEDQAADPLIASAEGAPDATGAPAYRGIAYAVFEDLALGEFGNRIPSLTFEVVADEGGAGLDAVARVAGGAVPDGGAAIGFAASGSARGVLAVLEQLGGGWWAPAGAGLALVRPGEPTATLVDENVRAAGLDGAGRARRLAAARIGAVAVAHYDPARDYQAGLQRAGPSGAAAERVEVPAVIDGGAARTLAAALVARTAADRVRRTVTTGLTGLSVAPGAVVAIAGETDSWRVVDTAWEAMAVRLQLAPVAPAPLPARTASSGRVLAAADEPVGATLLRLVDLPAGDDALPVVPRLGVVAAGEGGGWRRASLLWSVDGGASWTEAGESAAPGVVGTVEAAPSPAPATLVDRAGVLLVRLAREDMALADADADALDRGANLAAAGGELIQFGRAVPLGEGRWRLSTLLRGRRGTEGEAVAAGDGFALLDPAGVRVIDLPLAAIGGEVRVMAAGVADARPAVARLAVEGRAVRPPAPAQLRTERTDDGVLLRWTRRSRAGWRWVDGVDAPLGEEAERYRVVLVAADGATRQVECDAPALPIAAATWATIARVEVRQRGTWAESRPATITGGDGA